MTAEAVAGWRRLVPPSVRPYTEAAPLAALFLGVSSGAPYAMIAATLTTRLAQDGIQKSSITLFALAFLVYNLKFLWSWVVDGVYLPILGRLGQRVSWLLFAGVLVIAAIVNLGIVDPTTSLGATAIAAVLVGFAGATFDIVIDAYRIESLEPRQLGVGSGMSQYGWRIGSAAAGAVALYVAASADWDVAYVACGVFALPAMLVGLILGEPARHREPAERRSLAATVEAIVGPFREFLRRTGAWLVLLFILVHKVGDTLANLTFRLLFDELGFSNAEIANFDVLFGFVAYLAGIFIGGILYTRLGMKRSVLLSLWLMAVSNLSFAGLALLGHSNLALAGSIGFENLASGYGGVVVVAYFSALCDLRYTATHYALISAAASVLGRVLTGTTAGGLIELMGYFNFYLLTTVAAMPGILFFWLLMRSGLIDKSVGTAATTPAEAGSADP
jgi:MFS transporter, PAT family, beta-lactamase induction signal transducer AmpG